MANICLYKIKVRGRQRACYALVDMMPLYSWEKEMLSEEGTEEDFTLVFLGACKWSVKYGTSAIPNIAPFTDAELEAVADGDHWDTTMRDKSILLGVEIWCNSKDIDDSSWAIFEHYDRGRVINDECPKELHIKRGREYDRGDDIVITLNTHPIEKGRRCKVKFESGAYWYAGDYVVGDLVYSDGSMGGNLGRIIMIEDDAVVHALQKIKNKVGHASPYVAEDIDAIWDSFKPKDRKEHLVNKLGIDEKTTRKKFHSICEWRWTNFALNNNDWTAFLESLK